MITNQQRREKLRALPEEIQDLYGSLDATRILIGIAQKYQIEEKKDIFIDTIGDVMLGFYPKSSISTLLQQEIGVPDTIASQIDAELKALLAVIPDASTTSSTEAVPATPSIATEEVPTVTVALAAPKTDLQNAVSNIVAPASPSVNPLGARTMSGDISSIKSGASANTPLSPLTTVPRYAKPLTDIPRYDTPQK